MSKGKYFTTGQIINESGIYAVRHSDHRLPHEVTLLEGERFPRCGKCSDQVSFELLRAAADIYSHSDFQVRLYELPEIPEVDNTQAEALRGENRLASTAPVSNRPYPASLISGNATINYNGGGLVTISMDGWRECRGSDPADPCD